MGLFITFEGIEGSGKSTQIKLLSAELTRRGIKVETLREPGGTELGERIRQILLNDIGEVMSPLSELLLYEAARAEIVGKVLRPALADGQVVLLDRFTDSTVAYQGYGRGVGLETVRSANQTATAGLTPDLTILFDLEVEIGLKRAFERIEQALSSGNDSEDRFEKEAKEFHTRVREGFLVIAAEETDRVKVVDATLAIEELSELVLAVVEPLLKQP